MRISLVNVQFHEGNNIFPPLGMLYIAGALQQAGHSLQVLDGDPVAKPELIHRILAYRPELIGFSFLTMTYDRALHLMEALQKALPSIPLIAGGAHATADPIGTLSAMPLAAVVTGEGEEAAVELVEAIEQGGSLEKIPGVVTRKGCGPSRATIADLDTLPFPARRLLGHKPYLRPPGLIRGWTSHGIASMLGGRGCPFRCSYCASHQQLGRKVRLRSIENILSELSLLQKEDNICGMYWVDDVFTHNRDWVLELCSALRGQGLVWGCQSRADAVDGPLLRAMKAAGCVQIDIGVESGSERLLKQMHKGVGSLQIIEAFDMIHAAKIRTGASFILGFPGETEDDILATAALAKRIRSDWTVFFFATPYPGTELWQKTVQRFGSHWPAWGEAWNNRVGPAPLLAGGISTERLIAWRSQLQNQYFCTNYLHLQNFPFIARLASTLARDEVRRALAQLLFRGGRADDLVEAAFSAWRAA